jgi:hypothetical protein
LTAALKNLVGINGHKDWLPHHRIGSIAQGGDEYDSTFRLKQWSTKVIESIDRNRGSKINIIRDFVLRVFAKIIKYTAPDQYREGSWYGNDTLWRTVLDLNRLLIYADSNGTMQDVKQRKCLTIVDGIIAGEKEGPMEPDPRFVGVLVGGENPVLVDAVLATMIGFDYKKIPLINKGFLDCRWPLVDVDFTDIEIVTNDERWMHLKIGSQCDELCFEPSAGWKGKVEFDACRKPKRRVNDNSEAKSETNWV